MELRGAVALVTGGNGGLGQRICHALAKEGAHVAVMYAQSREQAEGVARELTSSYQINAAAFACDITDGEAVERLIGDVVRRLGCIDILVNDAAYNKAIPFTDLDNLTMEMWDKIMAVNLTGPMRLTKAVAPVMKGQGRGRIVNIASVAGLGPTGSSIAYAVSKAGLIHLTRCMAVALAPETLVNCVAPGLLEGTRATANLLPEMVVRNAGGVAAEEGGRQGRLRRHGGHHVPHRNHDRPDDRHRFRALLSLKCDHLPGRGRWLTKA
jgi:3-oxoacyl-[acyl-carrier protein] reductase